MNTEAADATDVVDIVFGLRGRVVDLDHADRLWRGLHLRMPWLDGEEGAGVHPLAGVSRGDGEMYLTRRARLTLRLPRHRGDDARMLVGARLDLGGEVEVADETTVRPLAPAKVLYSPFVTMGETDEGRFLAACREQLAAAGIVGDLVCGKARQATGEYGGWSGFSLMVHGLGAEESLRLQRQGLGGERKRGCGIFVPHKAVAAVGE
jgi:CRISPR-associated protein Cas6